MSLHKTFISFSKTGGKSTKSLADAELCNNGTVTFNVCLGQVVKQATPLTNHLVHTKSGMVIIRMTFQVLRQFTDALSQNSNLNFGRTSVVFVSGVCLNDFGLFFLKSFLISNSPTTKQQAERKPHQRHDPEAEFVDSVAYIIIRFRSCQEGNSLFFR